uniref:Uncharacterized protein n=1 Tax=Ciona savignyi TaxID=51511 RepID=H2Z823_CIOSA
MDQKEMQYACTKCMNWFDFDDLSADIQMCKGCTEKNIATSSKASETMEKKEKDTKRSRPENCKYCHTYIKVKVPGEKRICERCSKNRKEYGEPKICVFCQLNSAFIGTKCQRCSSSKKKYGMPVDCKKCNLKAAFDHKKARIEGELLCWKCYISTQRNKIREKRKVTEYDDKTEETDVKRSRESETTKKSSPDENERTWRELLGEDYGSKSARKTESNSARADKKHELRIQAQLNCRNSRKSDLDDRISKMEKRVA